jgi:hypothetical protein
MERDRDSEEAGNEEGEGVRAAGKGEGGGRHLRIIFK